MFLQKDRENYPQRSTSEWVSGFATGTCGVGGSRLQWGEGVVCVWGGMWPLLLSQLNQLLLGRIFIPATGVPGCEGLLGAPLKTLARVEVLTGWLPGACWLPKGWTWV